MVLMSKLPLSWLYGIGDAFAWVARRVLHYRERVIMTNLARSFPEKKYWDLDPIADEYYKHMGEIVAEAIWFGGSDYERVRKQRICTALLRSWISVHFSRIRSPSSRAFSR